MNYWVVDASVWVARLIPQDPFFAAAKTWFQNQLSEGAIFLSPALLLAEVAGAISRRTCEAGLAQRAIDQIKSLPGLRLVEMDQTLVQAAAQMAAKLGLRGADSFYVALAAQLKVTLVTLDKDQNERAAPVVAVHMLHEINSF